MKILTCVDLGALEPGHLVRRGLQLAARTDGVQDLLYVSDPRLDPEERIAQQRTLESLAQHVPERWRGRARIEQGEPDERIISASRAYDAVVVGPRSPSGLERLLKGPMARRVLSKAHSAVYVPRREQGWDPDPLRLLIGIDLEGAHESLVREAGWWAAQLRGRLDAMYVDRAPPPLPKDPTTRRAMERELDAQRQLLTRRVQQVIDHWVPERFRGQAQHGTGDPEEALQERTSLYDLVVVGTVPRPGLTGCFVGSVAQNIVRSAQCDVLTLPSVHRVPAK